MLWRTNVNQKYIYDWYWNIARMIIILLNLFRYVNILYHGSTNILNLLAETEKEIGRSYMTSLIISTIGILANSFLQWHKMLVGTKSLSQDYTQSEWIRLISIRLVISLLFSILFSINTDILKYTKENIRVFMALERLNEEQQLKLFWYGEYNERFLCK